MTIEQLTHNERLYLTWMALEKKLNALDEWDRTMLGASLEQRRLLDDNGITSRGQAALDGKDVRDDTRYSETGLS